MLSTPFLFQIHTYFYINNTKEKLKNIPRNKMNLFKINLDSTGTSNRAFGNHFSKTNHQRPETTSNGCK